MSNHPAPAPDRPALPSLTFLGHATMLIAIAGTRILTDPLVFERLLILRRQGSRLDPALHRDLDAVLISHLHVDHLHIRSLVQIGRETRVIMPAGGERLLLDHGFSRVETVRPGDVVTVGPVRVTATYAEHDGRRPPFGPSAPALGFLLEEGPTKVYFAGDTDVFPAMADLAPGLDVAMLPVWGWGPRLGHGHMNPRSAAGALRLLQPRYAVPIHWGTLWPYGFGRVVPGRLTDPPREFARFARRYAPGVRVLLTPPGEPVVFDPNGPDSALRAPRAKPPRAPRLPGLPGTRRRP
jgi:L-ascorbate metabolism protein UlaG (beta-lactamase superfamily)